MNFRVKHILTLCLSCFQCIRLIAFDVSVISFIKPLKNCPHFVPDYIIWCFQGSPAATFNLGQKLCFSSLLLGVVVINDVLGASKVSFFTIDLRFWALGGQFFFCLLVSIGCLFIRPEEN